MPVGPPAPDLTSTSARHTHDQYQAKWDKWDNDEFVEQMMAETDKSEERAAAGASRRKQHTDQNFASLTSNANCQRLMRLLLRLLPALVVGLLVWFQPPSSPGGWVLCILLAVGLVYLNGPTTDESAAKKD